MTALLTPQPVKAQRRVFIALAVLTGLSWLYLVLLAARMGDMGSSLSMPMTSAWTNGDAVLMFTMWAVMMAAMMLPSASPMISAYAKTVNSERAALQGSTPAFVTGYLIAWSTFAALATAGQWLLHDQALVTMMGESRNDWFGGFLLLAAGAYQFTAPKDACLTHCRSPLSFLLNEWRSGLGGALVMGVRHGGFCIGCCWALMALLFVLGVMNLWWIALVAAVVLLEKLIPSDLITRALGAGLIVWGALLLTAAA